MPRLRVIHKQLRTLRLCTGHFSIDGPNSRYRIAEIGMMTMMPLCSRHSGSQDNKLRRKVQTQLLLHQPELVGPSKTKSNLELQMGRDFKREAAYLENKMSTGRLTADEVQRLRKVSELWHINKQRVVDLSERQIQENQAQQAPDTSALLGSLQPLQPSRPKAPIQKSAPKPRVTKAMSPPPVAVKQLPGASGKKAPPPVLSLPIAPPAKNPPVQPAVGRSAGVRYGASSQTLFPP